MSATGRGAERRKDDRYYTPPWCVDRLLDALPKLTTVATGRWLEPGVGSGWIVRAVQKWHEDHGEGPGPTWDTCDIRDTRPSLGRADLPIHSSHVADYCRYGGPQALRDAEYDVILTNPPFCDAHAFARTAIRQSPRTILMLPVSFLATEGRSAWMRENTPALFVLPNRPSFTGEGTDASEYAWFVWSNEIDPVIRILAETPREERRKREELARQAA